MEFEPVSCRRRPHHATTARLARKRGRHRPDLPDRFCPASFVVRQGESRQEGITRKRAGLEMSAGTRRRPKDAYFSSSFWRTRTLSLREVTWMLSIAL